MAEETIQNPETPTPAPETPPVPVAELAVPEAEKPAEVKVETTEVPVEEGEEKKDQKIAQQDSFKEETNVVSELPESQRKALEDLKKLIQEALEKHEFSEDKKPEEKPEEEKKEKEEEPKTEEEPTKTEEEAPKTEESPAPAVETEEIPKTEETPVPVVETEETPVPAVETEETPVPAVETEEAPKTEETKEEDKQQPETTPPVEVEEKTVEAIKETIIEVAVTPAPEVAEEPEPEPAPAPEEVSIWGIPLLADERSDVILLKFLRARDFRVKDAFAMIRNTVRWRKEFEVDTLLEEEFGSVYEKVVFSHGSDKEGRPVVYNVFGEFQNKELYQNTFSDAEKRKKFLKWLIQFIEKTIRTLDFSPKGINTLVLVNDFKNSPGFGKRDLYKVIDKFLEILQDNYPEFVAKQVCVNVSWWYLAYNWIYLTVFTPRSKSKFVFASPSKSPDALFKYIAPEQVPVKFGGHSKEGGEQEFSPADPITEVTLKPGSKHPIEFALSEGTELVWELRVIGWEVSYGAEFLPTKEGGYTLNIAKPKKVTPTEEPIIYDTFKVTEAGKVVLTIDNQSTKKKKLFYRSKVKA